MTDSFRARLRALPDFPEELPDFDPSAGSQDPAELFRHWLSGALAVGVRQPHAFSLATADANGHVSSRMLILKDIDDDGGWQFATARTSRKGGELAENPNAAMNFYWPELGRQIRVAGAVVELSAEASAADWDARPSSDGHPNPAWQLYALKPREIEFWQARADRHHIRHRMVF
ncbi:pyridoxamine 5'-phosphate oxidase family protein [Arthrobacter sp. zg-Y826]|uniref:pyridoxine/pyridoxamine 5'-phosphate oxidase n=1 Tax=Arthrobacter jinronghuae TaxID=2964609 RepID=UPI002107CC9A|nr:pyridoxamine 5'-phosphate oxidase family protein [Arthrobacter jinronghuae]MCQ1958080.1 pyridoxamine 5'-phosphate oxidase family protein [Arthrobacter jinronghuae]